MGLFRTVYEIHGDFSQQSQNFPTPFYFASPLKGFLLELGISAERRKTRMMRLPGRQKGLTISSAVWIECTNVTDRRTDGQTLGHSKDRAYHDLLGHKAANKIQWNTTKAQV